MILKKPYGLLIKHFKLIHFILTILTAYIAVQSYNVVTFFSDYIANNYAVTIVDNMASLYINPFLYVLIILVIVMLIALFVLLRYKKKPNKIYLFTIIYYIIFLIAIIVASYLINDLSNGLWTPVAARQYRDFSQLIYWPQIIFIFLIAIRALGFNIKKFDFKNDIKELELSEKDSELIEINIGFDTTKVKRTFRRTIREFIYYFKENKFIIVTFIVIISLFLGYKLYDKYEKLTYNYDILQNFNYDGMTFKIEDSILTNLSYEGYRIDENKYYLLLKFTVTNNGSEDRAIDAKAIKLYSGNNIYYPGLDLGYYFIDYAKPYHGEVVKAKATNTYMMAYAINKNERHNNFKISIYNGASKKSNSFKPITLNIKLKPITIDEINIMQNVGLNDNLVFSGTYLNNTNLTIKDYLVTRSYTYKYKKCDNCQEYSDIIVADQTSRNDRTLLVIDYDFFIDPTSAYYLSVQNIGTFAEDFIKVRYNYDGAQKIVKPLNITPDNIKNSKLILQVSKELEQAQSIDLYITVRNKSYIVKLKIN